MPESKDRGSVPQGLLEQARAKPVDPGRLQMLGKKAAALHTENGTPLSQAVVDAIGMEEIGPEHTRRVCEFANQEAFQREWEKGGSVRNVEFKGGPADPAFVLRELHDGARQESATVSDYDSPPEKVARADGRVENQIFGKYACRRVHPTEVPSSAPELHRTHQRLNSARDHIMSKVSSLQVEKEAAARDLGDAVSDAVMGGDSLFKIASAWAHFCSSPQLFREALDVSVKRMQERGVPHDQMEKRAVAVGQIPNPDHPLIAKFVTFTKLSADFHILNRAGEIVKDQIPEVQKRLGAA